MPTFIDCGEFRLGPTKQVIFPGTSYSGFVAPVSLPSRIERHNGHLFAVAVSALVSFTLMRPAKSTRDDYLVGSELRENDFTTLGLQFPVLTAGPGAHECRLSVQTLENYSRSLSNEPHFYTIYPIKITYVLLELFDWPSLHTTTREMISVWRTIFLFRQLKLRRRRQCEEK